MVTTRIASCLTRHQTIAGLMMFALFGFISGCSDDSSSSPAEEDAMEMDTIDVQPIDTDGVDEPDADPSDDVIDPQDAGGDTTIAAELDFYLLTGAGSVGAESESIAVTTTDEVAEYADSEGFQVDIGVTSQGIENGKVVYLSVNDEAVSVSGILAQDSATGSASFQEVTLAVGENVLRVYVDGIASVEKTVQVNLGACDIEVETIGEWMHH